MHLAKYKRSSVASLIAHDERTIENHTNEKIDPSRSHLNYSLIDRGYDYYQKRLSEVFCINRKDINTIGSLVITLPKEVHEEDEERFFQKTFEYFSEMFGEKNVVSAEVHKDETTDHMHFKFIPVYLQEKEIKRGKDKGKKIQREAVSFDEVCPRELFRSLHKDFQKHIDQELGYHVGVLNGATKGTKTVEALKEATELERVNRYLQRENKDLIMQNKALEEENQALKQDKEFLMTTNMALRNAAEEMEKHIEIVEEKVEETKEIIQEIDNFENSKAANWIADFIEKVRNFVSEARKDGKDPQHISISVKALETLERALQPFVRLKQKIEELIHETNKLQDLIANAKNIKETRDKSTTAVAKNEQDKER